MSRLPVFDLFLTITTKDSNSLRLALFLSEFEVQLKHAQNQKYLDLSKSKLVLRNFGQWFKILFN